MFKKCISVFLLLSFCHIGQCQKTFNEFINLFPIHKWNELPEVLSILPLNVKLDIDKANKFMWEEHAKGIRLPVNNYNWQVNGPHYMLEDGSFNRSELGMYYKDSSRPDTQENSLYAVARVNLNSEIIILITYYDVFDLETGYKKHYDAFTYRLKDEKLISALDISEAIILPDYNIVNLEILYKETPDIDIQEQRFRITYELRKDGYFKRNKMVSTLELINDKVLIRSLVFDPEGSANIRSKPNLNSEVLFAVKNGEFLLLERINDPNWYRLAMIYVERITKETLPDAYKDRQSFSICGGYIHKSRVKEYKE